eukprot:15693-Heterococcus_DN1.PRE.2
MGQCHSMSTPARPVLCNIAYYSIVEPIVSECHAVYMCNNSADRRDTLAVDRLKLQLREISTAAAPGA